MNSKTDSAAKTSDKTPGYAWVILVVTYLASIAAPLAQFKVPALADSIIPDIIAGAVGFDPVLINTYFGLLMSALTIIAVILAFPASWIANKIGLKATILISLGCLLVGTAMGLVGTIELLFVGRFFEGIGIGLIGVVAPSCVSIWFPDKTRGLAMAIWATWVPLAIIVAFPLGPILAQTEFGYTSLYWVCIIFDVVAFILFMIFFKMPEGAEKPTKYMSFSHGWKYLKSPLLWLVCIVFFCYNFLQLGAYSNFFSVFLTENGWDPLTANNVVSMGYLVGIFAAIVAGVIFDRMKRKYLLWVFSFALWIVCLAFMYNTGDAMVFCVWIGFLVSAGVSGGVAAGTLRPYATMLVPNTALGATMAMGILQVSQNLGGAVGSPLYGAVAGAIGYEGASFAVLIPLCVISVILSAAMASKRIHKKQEEFMAEWQVEIDEVMTQPEKD